MLKRLVFRVAERLYVKMLSQNEMESQKLRRHFRNKHDVIVGEYSYGCFDNLRFPARTRIGRYCSFARTSRIIDANHPVHALTTHPYLYDARFGVISRTTIDPPCMVIEDDVWVGQNAVIMPGCKHIGRGAIIGAGAIVTKDVPAYAIVAGVPATIRRLRFSSEMIATLEQSRWWELSKAELAVLVRSNETGFLDVSAGSQDIMQLFEGRQARLSATGAVEKP